MPRLIRAFRWAHMPFCLFFNEAAHLVFSKTQSRDPMSKVGNYGILPLTVFLSFRRDRYGRTVQTQNRLLIRVYTVCNTLCIFWMHYSMETPSCSTFWVIKINFCVPKILGFLRYFKVIGKLPEFKNKRIQGRSRMRSCKNSLTWQKYHWLGH